MASGCVHCHVGEGLPVESAMIRAPTSTTAKQMGVVAVTTIPGEHVHPEAHHHSARMEIESFTLVSPSALEDDAAEQAHK